MHWSVHLSNLFYMHSESACVIDSDFHSFPDSSRFYERSTSLAGSRPRLQNIYWKQLKLTHLVFRLRTCLQSRPCSVCLYLCLTLQLFLGVVCLAVVSVLVVRPFREIATYAQGNCTPVRVTIDSGNLSFSLFWASLASDRVFRFIRQVQ